ncbi:unnamed protein product [Urochloa decumbens]|uniref:DUF1618 domain-containing protein n=1 Tax=Urochloa decumbens TaxID=240449 RepID=A0ABC9AR70_9POAL
MSSISTSSDATKIIKPHHRQKLISTTEAQRCPAITGDLGDHPMPLVPVASTRPDVVVATHRDVVLLEISAMLSPFSRADALVDYFVYHANGDPSQRLPSLSLLPVHYHEEKSFAGGKPSQVLLHKDDPAGRGGPGHSRSVCATRYGIKFVSVDSKHCSNWGVGHMNVLTWSHTFRITTWSLRKDDYTWRKDATMYEEDFLTVLRSEDHRFPRVTPEHPVINMENPDAVCFLLKKSPYSYEEPTWMVEVDVKKKVLLTATAHTKTASSSIGEEDAINSVRIGSHDLFFSTELPRYLDGAGQPCKRRRQ